MITTEKIKVFVINRNLLTTLKETVDFLLKESRLDVIIIDQASTYPPLLEYYKNNNINVIYLNENEGPYSVWNIKLKHYHNNNFFIVTDSDCIYKNVPDDWLDKMLNVLNNTSIFKVGFSLKIDDLPNSIIGKQAFEWESKYWVNKNDWGWEAFIDTTFALYRPNSHFSYDAIRLDQPYTITHYPWYITENNINEEWLYYLKNASNVSSWGSKIKSLIK